MQRVTRDTARLADCAPVKSLDRGLCRCATSDAVSRPHELVQSRLTRERVGANCPLRHGPILGKVFPTVLSRDMHAKNI
jgi:hypothetical protein